MNRYVAYFSKQCLVFVLVIGICAGFSAYMDGKIDVLYSQYQAQTNRVAGFGVKDKGNALIQRSLGSKDNILVMGSSELTGNRPFNIKYLFPNHYYQGTVSVVGHANVQNFHHAMNLGANYGRVKDNPIVVMEGFQWFFGKNPAVKAFFSNFSQQQFFEFLANDKISEKNKKYLCWRYVQMENLNALNNFSKITKETKKRVPEVADIVAHIVNSVNKSGLFNGEIEFPVTYVLAELYASDNIFVRGIYYAFKPYYFLRGQLMSLKDKFCAMRWLSNLEAKNETPATAFTDWAAMYTAGEKEGKESCTNNDIFVYDEYYDKYLRQKWDKLKNREERTVLMESTEWEDYRFLLELCRELEVKPYIVMESTNGLYYDYIGMTKDKRDAVYRRQEEMAKEYGMPWLSLKDKEYEPYFYCDVMHLGWKGWPYVAQHVVGHFAK